MHVCILKFHTHIYDIYNIKHVYKQRENIKFGGVDRLVQIRNWWWRHGYYGCDWSTLACARMIRQFRVTWHAPV